MRKCSVQPLIHCLLYLSGWLCHWPSKLFAGYSQMVAVSAFGPAKIGCQIWHWLVTRIPGYHTFSSPAQQASFEKLDQTTKLMNCFKNYYYNFYCYATPWMCRTVTVGICIGRRRSVITVYIWILVGGHSITLYMWWEDKPRQITTNS